MQQEAEMETRDTLITVTDYTAEAKAFLARYGLTADTLLEALSTDENGRAFNTMINLGGLVDGVNEQNERERAPRVLSHLQRALTPQPSGRWMPLVTRRAAQVKHDAVPRVTDLLATVTRDANRPAACLAAFVQACEAELKALERVRTDAQARLRQAEKELEPLQVRINAFLQANASRRTITHLIELVTTLLQAVDRGVGLTAVVLMAERLVNDREAHGLRVDAANAAMGILQEARGQAQARRDEIAQFVARCRAVAEQIASARASVGLAAHPYADVDLTDAALAERLNARIQTTPAVDGLRLEPFLGLDETQLYAGLHESALSRVRKHTALLSLLDLMDLQASEMQEPPEALAEGGDLVAATLEAAYRRVGNPSVELARKASPEDWWLVGVPDETNPGFAFEHATLVGSGRRDQIQFVHVQTGISPQDLTALTASRDAFEQAAAQRNYYVLDALATDDHARQVFALGLAGGLITVRGGEFALSQDGSQVTLGSTVDAALDQFIQQPEGIKAVEDEFNALPLATAVERLESYLARGSTVRDELWGEFASYARERLELTRHQMTFVGKNEG
jgi:hypothetical protein